MVPILQAEIDRDTVRRFDAIKKRETEIMSSNPNWVPLDLKAPVPGLGKNGERDPNSAEPVYHTERYVQPSLVFLPKDEPNFMSAQWWRGSKVFTKVPRVLT
jgi:hypothetical protein